MRSKKDKDTIIIVSANSPEELRKVLSDNHENWQEIKKPEVDDILSNFPEPQNRAERRGSKEMKKHRGKYSPKNTK